MRTAELDNWTPPANVDADQVGMVRNDHRATARAAAVEALPRSGTARRRVYDYLVASGGATDDEIQVALNMNPSTQRPRRVELVEAGFVRATEETRVTRWGQEATVWRTT